MDNNTNNSMNNYYTNNNQYGGNYNENNYNSYNQNNLNQENSFNQNNNKKKINKTLFLIIGIVFIAILIFFIFKGKSSYPNTVLQNETLKVYEVEGSYNFEVNVLSLKDNYPINAYFADYNGVVVQFKFKNISDKDLELSILTFYLLDDDGNKIESATSVSQGQVHDETNKLDFASSIPSGETVSGYVYFYDYDKEISLKDVSKIRIDVPVSVEKEGDVTHIKTTEYFIELN